MALQTSNTHSMHSVGVCWLSPARKEIQKVPQCLGKIAIISVFILCLGSYVEMFVSPTCVRVCGHVVSVAVQGVAADEYARSPHALYTPLLLY